MEVTKEEIINFLKKETLEEKITSETDIFQECGVSGDDFHELMKNYQRKFEVDMGTYLWYFHGDEEESTNIGGAFFKPPYERVTRIPLTPKILTDFANSKKWDIKYPEHSLPKRRYDLIINQVIFFLILTWLIWYLMKKWF